MTHNSSSRFATKIAMFYRHVVYIADYAVARCPSVRLSVCLSVTPWYSIETANDVLKPFSPPDSHTILVFPYSTLWQYSNGDPLTGASNAMGMKKIAIFGQ